MFRKRFFGEMTPRGEDPIGLEFAQMELKTEDASEVVGVDEDRVSSVRSHRFCYRDRFVEAVRDHSNRDRGRALPGIIGGYDLPENAIVLIANSRIVTNDFHQLDLLKPLARAVDVLDQDVALF